MRALALGLKPLQRGEDSALAYYSLCFSPFHSMLQLS